MKTSIATVTVPGNLREKLETIAAAGFDGVEIFEQDFVAYDGSPADVGNLVRDIGLEITLFQPFRDFEGLPDPMRRKAFDRAKRKFDLMTQMGADLVLICSNTHPQALGGIDRAADDLRELAEIAATRDLRIGYEALAWGRHVSDHRDAWEIVRRVNHPNAGLILDSFHTLSRNIDPNTIRSIPGDKIFFVQLGDAPKIDMDLLYWSRHFRNMPGEGDLDVTGFMRAVMATGYSGPISLEIFNDQFRGGTPRLVAVDGHRSLVNLMDQVRRAEPALKIPGPSLPAPVVCDGVAFIEFTTDTAGSERLGNLLRSMGFQHARQHIAKAVSVWEQGDIRIVINTDPTGFAHSAFVMHGTSVCDVGLQVTDAEATRERAEAMGAEPFSQPIGPGELPVPAVRGVGGSVMHFIDSSPDLSQIWTTEFNAVAPAGRASAGLKRIDHLAQTMNYDEMLSWSLFYTSIFDTKRSPMVDVVDPDGLVRSQAIQGPGGNFRLTLNGAESHRTFAGRHLADSYGSAVQHVAFATDDIFATSQSLRRFGFEPLKISDNYYDDLAARFDIDEDELAKMKAGSILFDMDENGAFYQVYSRTFGEGMFFEIIQRVAGYDGYGGPNAPFRVAAQKRDQRAKGIPKA
ncbi:bifunctional sugar phosphate isomerase/epimerase/4-hydroxyphenylpyruvate dioxygenase family protein [Pseudoprimorskyibacter insulae]|uniref:3-dehydroshikimate dehydratase n=1 Tax=Pseudoprimorskyibacter insulae TaxID=1695997 RepID=A0A2R8AUC3_9RHOB|nr:sugar phosphate isomerase/epimerase and 4-hydroxyphenylpyruvate domain-containing protein [Pseudoprimorskyibacter insulae]SPF79580.1 4-hydroxyphenylpyruvate dioxygenase [Pseudoprimorskyibacter insulae]